MRKMLKVVGWILGVVVVLALGATGVARVIAGRKYERHWATHDASFPIPFPLSAAEVETLRAERLAAGAPAADPFAGVDLAQPRCRARSRAESTWSRHGWAVTDVTGLTSAVACSSTRPSSATGPRRI